MYCGYIIGSGPTQFLTKIVLLDPRKKGKQLKHLNMSSTITTIPNEDEITLNKKKKFQFAPLSIVSSIISMQSKHDMRKVIHSIKVGIALVLVSLLYLLDPLYKQVGDNALWAIMTVVVIFEFSAGLLLF